MRIAYSYRVVALVGQAGDLDKTMSDLGSRGYRLRDVTAPAVALTDRESKTMYALAIFERVEEPTS